MGRLDGSEILVKREFTFTRRNFERIVDLINRLSGISLSDRKTDMVYSRLARRIRRLGMRDFDSYIALLESDDEEKVNFINALTTNLTHFFRESHHFDYLKDVYIPELIQSGQKRIRFWSAGCSTGEEPYSLAMVWQSIANKPSDIDFKILATDLDTNVLQTCKRGVYSEDKLKSVESQYQKCFVKSKNCQVDEREAVPELKSKIYFKQLNLMHEWPMKGPFDLIICRNVLIYFDKPTQKELVSRYENLLKSNGCLMLGHSENLSAAKNVFSAIGRTTYRKVY
ncbi:protein-glutamate O-methyltransferase CheR [Aliikangiella sp. G2MR2-5]|uniref:CheR family methyltransferase n=1 Tax=Aliikangiella sp. G2MR2-5 TaxID=2788943 RepID=UPI0018AA9DF0|nr:protein-glutamate O-methyltransferase CheR [Aliikangiella sp. G2MR2-5]